MSSIKEASNSLNAFSVKLYSKLAKDNPKENIFYSPTSICIALAMTYAGAKGNTAKEIEQTMNWNRREKVHEMMKELQELLFPSCGTSGMELELGNRLWAQSGFSTLEEFTKILQCCYQAEMGVVDYQNKTEEARQAINDWVAGKTKGKISDLLAKGVLTADTRLVLTNAVYFKGYWHDQFNESSTRDWDFKVSKTIRTKIKMMNKTAQFMYAKNEALSCQVLKLPYKLEKVAMVILLPNEDDGLPELEGKVNADTISQCNRMVRKTKVRLSLPKFKINCKFNLNNILKQLGMNELFGQAADLSGITGNKDLFVSDVVHQAYVDVNEKGTEAAAATAVVMTLRCAIPREQPPHFLADHPFMFIIQHCESEAILFVGRIGNPQSH